MDNYSLTIPLVLQFCAVSCVAFVYRHHLPLHINVLVSSLFITVPIFWIPTLADNGMIFTFDLLVPILIFRELWLHGWKIPRLGMCVSTIVFFPLLFFFPLSYFFLPAGYEAFHSLITISLLYRALVICAAVGILIRYLQLTGLVSIARLAATHAIILLLAGTAQYLIGIDLVVYERLKDTENITDLLLGGEQKILFGFGFLGLFRGAVPQIAILGLTWAVLASNLKQKLVRLDFISVTCLMLGVVCVVGTFSRAGMVSIFLITIYYILAFSRHTMTSLGVMTVIFFFAAILLHILAGPQFDIALDTLGDRFSFDQFTGSEGSGVTRIQSAQALLQDMQDNPWRWFIGIGGFNPIAANELYGVFGMHGDYLDVFARHGIFVGALISAMVLGLFLFVIRGKLHAAPHQRVLSKAMLLLAVGLGTLALFQNALTFSGAAGYLVTAQSWIVISAIVHSSLSFTHVSAKPGHMTEREPKNGC